jgi:hypothetical protein
VLELWGNLHHAPEFQGLVLDPLSLSLELLYLAAGPLTFLRTTVHACETHQALQLAPRPCDWDCKDIHTVYFSLDLITFIASPYPKRSVSPVSVTMEGTEDQSKPLSTKLPYLVQYFKAPPSPLVFRRRYCSLTRKNQQPHSRLRAAQHHLLLPAIPQRWKEWLP